jgi:hypothetical protein
MSTLTTGIVVLDPTTGPRAERVTRAPRPESLRGKRVGFLDNGKANSDRVLLYLDELLRERYGIGASIHRRKPSSARVLPAALLQELTAACDLVVPGIGD